MLKERYRAMNDSIHADDELIDRTLDAIDAVAAKPHTRSVGFQLAVGFVCVLVLLVVAAARIVPPPRDVVAATNQTAVDGLLPFKNPPPDAPTLTVSHITLINEHELSFILTLQGGKVDQHTMIGYSIEKFIFDSCTVAVADDIVPPAANERSFCFTLKYKAGPILAKLGDALNLEIVRYSSHNQAHSYSIFPDWATVDFTRATTGEALYEVNQFFDLTGYSLTEAGELIVTTRSLAPAGSGSNCLPTLFDAAANSYHRMREARTYSVDNCDYVAYTFDIHRDELTGMSLILHVQMDEEIIEGSWPFTVDLSQLTAE